MVCAISSSSATHVALTSALVRVVPLYGERFNTMDANSVAWAPCAT